MTEVTLNSEYFYSETDNKVNIVSLVDDDDKIYTIDGAAAKLFVALVNNSSDDEEQIKKSFNLSDNDLSKFKEELIDSLVKVNIFLKE